MTEPLTVAELDALDAAWCATSTVTRLIADLRSARNGRAEITRHFGEASANLNRARVEIADWETWAETVSDLLPDEFDGDEGTAVVVHGAVAELVRRLEAVVALCDQREAQDCGLVRIADVRATATGGCTRCQSYTAECRCAELFT